MVVAWLLLLALCMDDSCQASIVLIMHPDFASDTDDTQSSFLFSAIKALGRIDPATTYTVL